MLRFIEGNLFDSTCHFLVNTVNLVGVQGKGIALQFKQWAPPAYFKAYVEDCRDGNLNIGQVTGFSFTRDGRYNTIINFPTKIEWRNPSKLEWIRPGLVNMAEYIYNNTSGRDDRRCVALPKLGCTNGGLNWPDVRSIIKDWYCDLAFTLNVEVYV